MAKGMGMGIREGNNGYVLLKESFEIQPSGSLSSNSHLEHTCGADNMKHLNGNLVRL